MNAREMERIVNSLDRIPTLPVIYTKLGKLLQSPDATIAAVSHIISEDPVIAAKVLKFVNSAFYGFPQRLGSLQRAIVILGFSSVKSLILATSVFDMFRDMDTLGAFDKKDFWKHCLGCAVASRVLAEAADLRNPDEVFTGGLLHDIGKLVVAVHFPADFDAVITEIQATGAPMVEVERKVFGFDHSQIGSALAVQWRLPAEAAQMIGSHHMGDESGPARKDIAAVHIGNILCTALGLGASGERKLAQVDLKAWALLGLSRSSLELIMDKIVKLYTESTQILEL